MTNIDIDNLVIRATQNVHISSTPKPLTEDEIKILDLAKLLAISICTEALKAYHHQTLSK